MVFISSFVGSIVSKAQSCDNLVRNPSFEDAYISNCNPQLNGAANWDTPSTTNCEHGGTPDLFSNTYVPAGGTCFNLGIPTNYCGSQSLMPNILLPVQSVKNYAGFRTISVTNLPFEKREYLQQELHETMQNGTSYLVTMHVSLADFSKFATEISILFSANKPTVPCGVSTPIIASPQITFDPLTYNDPTGLQMTNKNQWVKLTTTITTPPNSNWKFITIGNFKSDANTSMIAFNNPPGQLYYNADLGDQGYYYIDNISIIKPGCTAALTIGACSDNTNNSNGVQNSINSSDWVSQLTNSSNNTIYIGQSFNFNTPSLTLTNKTIILGENVELSIAPNCTLTVQNSTLMACNKMWGGFLVENTGSRLVLNNNIVMQAKSAVKIIGNVSYTINSNTFRDNYTSIEILNKTNSSGSIQANTFTAQTSPLLSPYTSFVRPLYHIKLNNVSAAINIGTSTNGNNFSLANFGIYAENASFNSYKNQFTAIRPHNDLFQSVAIWANNYTSTTKRTINIGDIDFVGYNYVSNNPSKNSFSTTDRCIYINGYCDSFVEGCQFTGNGNTSLTYPSNLAVYFSNPWPSTLSSLVGNITVKENRLNQYNGHIDVALPRHAAVTVSSNQLSNTGSSYGRYGIRVKNTSTPGTTTNNITINDNSIIQSMNCIETSFLRNLRIQNNSPLEPKFVSGAPQSFHGILSNNCDNALIEQNTVTGNFSDWRCIGIRVESSLSNTIRCNYVSTTGRAFFFGNTNTNTLMHTNTMDNAEYGVYLNYGTIGDQVNGSVQKNGFTGTFTSHLYSYESNGQNSKFYFLTGDNILFNPAGTSFVNTQRSSTNSNVFVMTALAGVYNASYDPSICSGGAPGIVEGWVQKSGEADGDSSQFSEEEIVEILEQDSIIPAFPDESKEVVRINLFEDLAISQGLNPDLPQTDWLIMPESPNVGNIYRFNNKLGGGDLGGANSELNNINASDEFFSLYKVFYSLYTEWYANPDSSLDENKKVQFEFFANLCIYQYDEIVYSARNLLGLYGYEGYTNDCENGDIENVTKKVSSNSIQNISNCTLYPNPAKNEFFVRVDNEFINGTISIINRLGDNLLGQKINNQSSKIDIKSLPSGLYIVQIKSPTHKKVELKLIVI